MPETALADATLLEVTAWLAHEAELLDEGRLREWLELVTDDVRYLVPVRTTRDRGSATTFPEGAAHFDDTHFTLSQRIARLETEYAWAEDPPSRIRHHVGNVRVATAEHEGELLVRSYLLFFRSRGDDNEMDNVVSAERHDVLRRVDGELRLARRTVLLDQARLPTHNLTTIL
jgi:3-phenylpropionate/cinnamic acid dioxygenase small subunit